jgi:hypothetical protein
MAVSVQNENDYEDLLSLWSDLEAGIGIILTSPSSIQEFALRVRQYDRWMQTMIKRDADVGLYLLFQLATNSPVGYSASHALVCAVLCHLIAEELRVSKQERDSLVHAALTMNIGMTALQDILATQVEKPTETQLEVIRSHAGRGIKMLAKLGVTDTLWMDIVVLHHDESTDQGKFRQIAPEQRLARILRIVDRYAAMISPRQSRTGRSTADSIRSIVTNTTEQLDDVGHALIRVVGLYPPGTYVKLDSGAIAVVMRRSEVSSLPHVAIVIDDGGDSVNQPQLQRDPGREPRIEAALAASAVRLRLNHHLVLQLGAQAAERPRDSAY